MHEIFSRGKVSERCLSQWQIAQGALGLWRSETQQRLQSVLDSCAHCREQLEHEKARVQAAAHEEVPGTLLDQARTLRETRRPSSHRRWRFPLLGGALAAGLAAWLVLPMGVSHRNDTRLKGDWVATVAVLRGTQISEHSLPLANGTHLGAGDRIRLRWPARQAAFIVIEGFERGRFTRYFAGEVPADGWIPVGIRITGDGETRLRITSCKKPPSNLNQQGHDCVARSFDL